MTITVQCPSCSAEHEVEMAYTRPEPSVGYGGGWEIEDAPDVCGEPGDGDECHLRRDGDPCHNRAVYALAMDISCAPVTVSYDACAECAWTYGGGSLVHAASVAPLPPCGYRFTDRDRERWEERASWEAEDRRGEAQIADYEEGRR